MENKNKKVKELRNKMGAGLNDCRKALIATDWDIEKASQWLRNAAFGMKYKNKKEEDNNE